MDSETLVANLIEDGSKLVHELAQHGFEIAAAFWLQESEDDKWYFYLVSPTVDTDGIREAYRQLHGTIHTIPEPDWLNPMAIKLIGPTSPLAQDVQKLTASQARPRAVTVRWPGRLLGNVSVENAYIYPSPVAAP